MILRDTGTTHITYITHSSEKKHVRDIKIFLKKKKTKNKIKACARYQKIIEKEKEKNVNIIMNVMRIFPKIKNKS